MNDICEQWNLNDTNEREYLLIGSIFEFASIFFSSLLVLFCFFILFGMPLSFTDIYKYVPELYYTYDCKRHFEIINK